MNIVKETNQSSKVNRVAPILPFYHRCDLDFAPDEITIDKFEEYANYRVELYLLLDKNELKVESSTSGNRKTNNTSGKDYSKEGLMAKVTEESKEKDLVSHFIMRAAYSSSAADQNKFIEREVRLFMFRLQFFDPKEALAASGYKVDTIKQKEMKEMFGDYVNYEKELSSSTNQQGSSDYFCLSFEDACRQLSKRTCLLRGGKAYISMNYLTDFIISHFEEDLRKEMEYYATINHRFQDERMEMSFKQLTNISEQVDDTPMDAVTPSTIPRLVKQSFPLCMVRMYRTLCEKSHLYYDGREQLGRFLRGIGLSMEGSLEFFQSHFTRKISVDKFAREYSYNIRYIYGKEGRRVALNACPCSVMIKSRPTGEQCHGCPFACMRESELEMLLKNIGLSSDKISDIIQYYREDKYEIACREYFKAIHPGVNDDNVVQHPVLWYKKSRKYYEEKK